MITVLIVYQQRRFPWLHYATARGDVAGGQVSVSGPVRLTQAGASRAAERRLLRRLREGA